MAAAMSELVDYLKQIGAAEVEHTDGTYLGHTFGVYRDLKKWNCAEDVCLGGMFHSIYGTEIFQSFSLPLEKRAEVRELIGERAERLAYLNSAIVYASFDKLIERGGPPYTMLNRFTGAEIEISPDDFKDLCVIHLCDRLEQALRSRDWEFRPKTFRQLAEQLGGVAEKAYHLVYSAAPSGNA